MLVDLLKPATRMLPPEAADLFWSLPLALGDVPPLFNAAFRAQFPALPILPLSRKLSHDIDMLAAAIRPIADDFQVDVEDLLPMDALVAIPERQRALWTDRLHPKDHFPVPQFPRLRRVDPSNDGAI
jgi:hypothetical protein